MFTVRKSSKIITTSSILRAHPLVSGRAQSIIMTRAKVLYFSGEIPQGDPEGDQQELFRKLHLLSKERNHPVLASFLESVTSAVRDECSRLSRDQKKLIPSFESVLDLTDHVLELRKTAFGGAIERVLVLVFQLGSFIA